MTKVNKTGWIRNRTGKAPKLSSSAIVEISFRDGEVIVDTYDRLGSFNWTLSGRDCGSDIMAYRVVESQEEVNPNSTQKAHRLIAIDSNDTVTVIYEITDDMVNDLRDQGFDLPTTEIVNINTGEKKKLLTDLSHLTNWE